MKTLKRQKLASGPMVSWPIQLGLLALLLVAGISLQVAGPYGSAINITGRVVTLVGFGVFIVWSGRMARRWRAAARGRALSGRS